MPALPTDQLVALAKRYADEKGIPASLVYSMILTESTGKPEARSGKGALGLMQLKDTAAQEMGYSHEDMADPNKNVKAGVGYVAKMLRRFQDPGRALSAYNAGPGATRKFEDLHPAAEPYVDKITKLVEEFTAEGQPFEEERNVGNLPLPMQTQKKLKVKKYIDELLERRPASRPPMLMAGGEPAFDEDGIRGMLSNAFPLGR